MLLVTDDVEVHQKQAAINNNKAYAFSYPANVNDIGDVKKNSSKKTVKPAKPAKPVKSSKNANSKNTNSKNANSQNANLKNQSKKENLQANLAPTTINSIAVTDTNLIVTTNRVTTTKGTNIQQFVPETTPKEVSAKVGNQDAYPNTSVNPNEPNGDLGLVAGVVGVALLAFGLVGLFIHRKVNAGKKKDIENDMMSDSNDAFGNNKPPDTSHMSQLMETNNDDNLKETSYDVYSNEVNIPSIEPLSPLQLSPNNIGSQILNDDPCLPISSMLFANNFQPPVVSSRQSFYGESMYPALYTMTPSLSSQDLSQPKSSFVDLSRSTAYPVPFVAVSDTSDINNYDNIKETVRYSIESANLNDVDNYILEPEYIRPDSTLLTDLMNSPLDEKIGHQITNNSTYDEPTNDKSTYLPTNPNDVTNVTTEISLSNPVVPIALDSNIKGQPFNENSNIHQDSNNAYTNQNIQMDYVQPNQGTIHIETLDLNITDSTVAPAKESLDIQPDISKVTESVSIGSALSNIEGDFNDTSSPETPVVKPNRASIQIMKTEIVPVQSNMQIEKIQDIIQNNSENTNDPSSDTDSPSQTPETNPLMMTPATTVFVNPIQSKMKIEKVSDEPQSSSNKPFISTPSAYIAERASAFTMQSATPAPAYKKKSSNNTLQNPPPLPSYNFGTLKSKIENANTTVTSDAAESMTDLNNEITGKSKQDAQKNKGITDIALDKGVSSTQVDDGLNKVESDNGVNEMKPLTQKKPAHRDSDQEPVPRKSILKKKAPKSQKTPQDLKIANDNDLTPPRNTVEKSETQYRSPTFSMYKIYDDLPGGRNSTMQPNVPEMPSSKPDNINSNENDS
ncbi:10730_t:CDS:2 [Cetraspora pellucida]|uniref:10730_t:CDS:1 n=1 Tax=Cetraspora pellucida TaxID=1433469 RepID=A0A9N9N2W2_9GLOM|nr:10730_t:CDS:2 [Cetraspora pellucida]